MELKYTALKQLLMTALAISVGGFLLNVSRLALMISWKGIFGRSALVMGFTLPNTMLLSLLYFTDYQGRWAVRIFAAGTSVFTVFSFRRYIFVMGLAFSLAAGFFSFWL